MKKILTHSFFWIIVLGGLAIFSWQVLGFSWSEIDFRDFSFQHWFEIPSKELTPLFWQKIMSAFYETFLMAYLGTFLGVCIGIPLVFLAGKPVVGPRLSFVFRSFFSFLRSTPTLLWAVITVILVGLGPLAGTIALILVTIGYFGKLITDEFDQIPPNKAQALQATGASPIALVRFVYWPILKPKILVTALFLFEYNIRHSAVLGLVGAGGIGYYIAAYLKWLEYGMVMILIVLIFIVVMILEGLTTLVKKHFLGEER